jgi:hypothetical protein
VVSGYIRNNLHCLLGWEEKNEERRNGLFISHMPMEKPKCCKYIRSTIVNFLYKRKGIDESMITHVNIIEQRRSVFTCERLDHAALKKKKKNKTLLFYPKLPPTHNI